MNLIDDLMECTQIERDHIIEWLRVNRPADLRDALRALGYRRKNKTQLKAVPDTVECPYEKGRIHPR